MLVSEIYLWDGVCISYPFRSLPSQTSPSILIYFIFNSLSFQFFLLLIYLTVINKWVDVSLLHYGRLCLLALDCMSLMASTCKGNFKPPWSNIFRTPFSSLELQIPIGNIKLQELKLYTWDRDYYFHVLVYWSFLLVGYSCNHLLST